MQPMQVAPPGSASSATWRPKLKLLQVTPPLRNLKLRTFITGNRLFHSLFSPATCHPASRTCKLDANYRGELNAPVGLVSHPPTLSIFNSFFSVYAVFCGSLWCVDIYKSVCQRYMLALVCFSPMVPEIFFIHSIQLAQQPNKN